MKRSSSFSIKSLLFVMCLFVITAFAAVSARADEGEEVTVDNGIPVVYLNIDESQGTIDELINSPDHSAYAYGKISIVVPEGFHYSDFEDLPCESIDGISMSIRGRGNSSWKQSGKRPFKIKLDKKTDIFGLGSNKHWVLLANAFDETLIRNRITGWLGEQMGFDFTPRGVPVDLVLKGEIYGTHYLGSYYLSENVRVDKNRLEIEELDEDDTDPDIITGGYLIQNSMQVRKGSPDRFTTIRGAEWATHTPSFDTEEETLSSEEEDGEEAFAHSELGDAYKNNAQQEYIQNYIQHFEDVLFEEGTAYRDLMDVENSAKYWLINTFPKNQDGYGTGSTYIYKDRDKDGQVSKLYWGPVWDFDFAWTRNFNVEGFTSGHKWLGPMFYDRGEGGFVQEIKKQWPAMRTSLEELIAEGGVIDKYYEETKVSAQMDHETLNPGEEFDYKAAVDRLKTWIRDRIDWVDANLDLLDEMVHKVTFIADGEVFAFDFYPVEDYLTGRERYPEKEGYTFLGWYDEDGNKIENQTYLQEDITLTARYVADDEVTHATDIAFGKDSDIVGYNAFFSTYKIQYEILPVDAFDKQLVWTSSDESIATVDENGFVKYYGPGTVVFTAALRLGRTRQFTLTIADGEPPAPDSIRPEEDVIRMKVGEQAAFTILTDPNPAKIRGYEYESDDTDVVTVEELGVLSAVGPGETEVHVIASAVGADFEDITLETKVKVIVTEDKDEPESESGSEPESEEESESGTEPESGTEEESESGTEPESGNEPAKIVYTATVSPAGGWTKDSLRTVTITVKRSVDDNTCFSHFKSVQIDGTLLKQGDDYDAKAGSTIVTLKVAALQKLTAGNHTVTVNFDDGKVEAALKVSASGSGSKSPKTGEGGLIAVLAAIALIGVSSVIMTGRNKRKI